MAHQDHVEVAVTKNGRVISVGTATEASRVPALDTALAIEDKASVLLVKDLSEGGEWSVPRAPVPKLLAKRGVTEPLWQQSYDGTVQRHRNFESLRTKIQRNAKVVVSLLLCFLVASTLVPVVGFMITGSFWFLLIGLLEFLSIGIMCRSCKSFQRNPLHVEAAGLKEEWKAFVQQQQSHYKKLGIDALLTFTRTNNSNDVLVGAIAFKLVHEFQPKSSSQGLMEDLSKLKRMWDDGLLTEEEFKQAKSTIWRDYDIGQLEGGLPLQGGC